MAARRNRTAPYEIMGRLQRQQPPPQEPKPESDPTPPAPKPRREWGPMSPSALGQWGRGLIENGWSASGAGVPIVLRVPRGVAVLAAGGLVGLIVLAYWVGAQQTGGTPAPAETGAAARAAAQRDHHVPDMLDLSDTRGGATAAGNNNRPRIILAGGPRDPRQAGLNYFIIARRPPDQAHRLARYLSREHRVRTVLDPVSEDWVRIWVVNQGFTADEYASAPAYFRYKRKLQAIGRAWQRHNGGQGDDLGSMYPHKYQPKP